MLISANYKKLSYRLENRASAWRIRLTIMLLSGICFFTRDYTYSAAKRVLTIVILSVCMSVRCRSVIGTDSSPGEIETPGSFYHI